MSDATYRKVAYKDKTYNFPSNVTDEEVRNYFVQNFPEDHADVDPNRVAADQIAADRYRQTRASQNETEAGSVGESLRNVGTSLVRGLGQFASAVGITAGATVNTGADALESAGNFDDTFRMQEAQKALDAVNQAIRWRENPAYNTSQRAMKAINEKGETFSEYRDLNSDIPLPELVQQRAALESIVGEMSGKLRATKEVTAAVTKPIRDVTDAAIMEPSVRAYSAYDPVESQETLPFIAPTPGTENLEGISDLLPGGEGQFVRRGVPFIAQNLMQTVGTAGLTILNPRLGYVSAFAGETADAYQEATKVGMSPEQARVAALTYGTVAGFVERFGADRAFASGFLDSVKKGTKESLEKAVAEGATSQIGKNVLPKLLDKVLANGLVNSIAEKGEGALFEGLTEVLQTNLQEKIVKGEYASFEESTIAGLVGAYAGGTVSTIGSLSSSLRERKLSRAQAIEKLNKLTGDNIVQHAAKTGNLPHLQNIINGNFEDLQVELSAMGLDVNPASAKIDVEGYTPEVRDEKFKGSDPLLHTLLSEQKGGMYEAFLNNKQTISDVYEAIRDAANTGDFSAFSKDEAYVLRSQVMTNTFANFKHVSLDGPDTLPIDRALPIYNALVGENVGDAGAEARAELGVSVTQRLLWGIARNTINPVTGKYFTSVADFVNTPNGQLHFKNIKEDIARQKATDIPNDQVPQGFSYRQGDADVIDLVFGQADVSTPLHEGFHFLLSRLDPASPLASTVLSFVNNHLEKRGDIKRKGRYKNIKEIADITEALREGEFSIGEAIDRMRNAQESLARFAEVYMFAGVVPESATAEDVKMMDSFSKEMRSIYSMYQLGEKYNVPYLGNNLEPDKFITDKRNKPRQDLKNALDFIFYGGMSRGGFTTKTLAETQAALEMEVMTPELDSLLADVPDSLFTTGTSEVVDDIPAIPAFADRIAAGEQMQTPEDLQFYKNNAQAIELYLKQKSEMAPVNDSGGSVPTRGDNPEVVAGADSERQATNEPKTAAAPVTVKKRVTLRPADLYARLNSRDPLIILQGAEKELGRTPTPAEARKILGNNYADSAQVTAALRAAFPEKYSNAPVVSFDTSAKKDLYRLETDLIDIAAAVEQERVKYPERGEKYYADKVKRLQDAHAKSVLQENGIQFPSSQKNAGQRERSSRKQRTIDTAMASAKAYREAISAEYFRRVNSGENGTVVIDAPSVTGEYQEGAGTVFYQTKKVKAVLPETKVVDEKGFPRRVFHGTQRLFSKFDEAFFGTGSGGDLWGTGFYFSEDPRVSSNYATRGIKPSINEENFNALVDKLSSDSYTLSPKLASNKYNVINEKTGKLIAEISGLSVRTKEIDPQTFLSNVKRNIEYYLRKLGDSKGENGQSLLKLFESSYGTKPVLEYNDIPPANIHLTYLDIRNPIEVDAPAIWTEKYSVPNPGKPKLPGSRYRLTPKALELAKSLLGEEVFISDPRAEDAIIETLARKMISLGSGTEHATLEDMLGDYGEARNKALEQLKNNSAFDGVTHIGQSGARQWIAWRSAQIHHVSSIPMAQTRPQPRRDKSKYLGGTAVNIDSIPEPFYFPELEGMGIDWDSANPTWQDSFKRMQTIITDKDALRIVMKKADRGDLLEAHELGALHNLMVAQMERIHRLVERGGPTAKKGLVELENKYVKMYSDAASKAGYTLGSLRMLILPDLVANLSKAISKHARINREKGIALAQLRPADLAALKELKADDIRAVTEFFNKTDDLTEYQQRVVEQLSAIDPKKETGKFKQLVAESIFLVKKDKRLQDLVVSASYAGMLSSPGGRGRDLASNFLTLTANMFTDAVVGVPVDMLAALWRGHRTKYLSEVMLATPVTGVFKGGKYTYQGKSGLQIAKDIMRGPEKGGLAWQEYTANWDLKLHSLASAWEIEAKYGTGLRKALGRAMVVPTRAVIAVDAFGREASREVMGRKLEHRLEKQSTPEQRDKLLQYWAERYVNKMGFKDEKAKKAAILNLKANPLLMIETGAQEFANENTFQGRPDPLISKLMEARDWADDMAVTLMSTADPIIERSALPGSVKLALTGVTKIPPLRMLFMKFVATPWNLMKGGSEYIPLALAPTMPFTAITTLASAALNERFGTFSDQGERRLTISGANIDKFIAKQLAGHLLLLFLHWMMNRDEIIGPSRTPGEKADRQFKGIPEYGMKVRLGDMEEIINLDVQPFSWFFIPVINSLTAMQKAQEDGLSEEEQTKILFEARKRAWTSFIYNSVIGDSYRSSEQMDINLPRQGQMFVPFSAFFRDLYATYNTLTQGQMPRLDTYADRNDGFSKTLQKGMAELPFGDSFVDFYGRHIGGFENGIPEKFTYFGETIGRSTFLGFPLPKRWFKQLQRPAELQQVDAEFSRLGYYPNIPDDTITLLGKKVKLTQEEHRSLSILFGRLVMERSERLLRFSNYQHKSTEEQAEMMKKEVADLHKEARDKVIREYKLYERARKQPR